MVEDGLRHEADFPRAGLDFQLHGIPDAVEELVEHDRLGLRADVGPALGRDLEHRLVLFLLRSRLEAGLEKAPAVSEQAVPRKLDEERLAPRLPIEGMSGRMLNLG